MQLADGSGDVSLFVGTVFYPTAGPIGTPEMKGDSIEGFFNITFGIRAAV